ncbi:PepSY domain-containing protein [Solitalea sp. MAHUQ-68]|uniref:PepSY domain-containing protein n=1 Tax=Solitalea agri TaxID=2953739 RepID=A0A9X2JCF3_9SPHI|nr:PepSY-associated TM helix domain-containing protein [Solitalea agri]MCO4291730.1 PepSY domain-containing protein [Solitalea agri]
MKVFFRNIHLYLSLSAGLIIFISCLTGTILVFEEELEHSLHHNRYFVTESGSRLPLDLLVKNAVQSTPKSKLASVKVYEEEARTIEVSISVPEKNKKEEAGKSQPKKEEPKAEKGTKSKEKKPEKRKPTLTAYVNPYTGNIIEVVNRRDSFFFTVESIHRWLLGGKDSIGNLLTGISTFIFFFILITGIILWWPKTKKIFYQRLKIKFDGNWKRLVHDLHIVTGFYLSLFLIIISLTGLVMAFNWVNKGIFTLTGSKMENPEPPTVVYQKDAKHLSIDEVYSTVLKEVKSAESFNIRIPKDSVSTFSVNVLPENTIETAGDNYFVNPYNAAIVGVQKFSDKNQGQKIRAIVKPLHTGALYGLPTKIISFLICLLTLSFPVTGVIMWLNRLKIDKKKSSKSSIVETA